MKNETSDKQGKILSEKELEKVTGGKRETYSALRKMAGLPSVPNCEVTVGTNLNNSGTEGYSRQAVNPAAISPTGPDSPHSPRDADSSLMEQMLESGAISEEVYAKWESSEAVEAAKAIHEDRISQINQHVAEEFDAMIAASKQNATKNFPPADGDPETASEK